MTRSHLALIKTLLVMLVATAATPAFAVDERGGRTDRAERFEGRTAPSAMRSQRSFRIERSTSAPFAEPGADEPPAAREQRRPMVRRRLLERAPPRLVDIEPARNAIEQGPEAPEPRSSVRRTPRFVEVEPARPTLDRREAADSVRDWRRVERGRTGSARPALVEQRTDTGWEPLRKREEQTVEGVTGIRRAPRISRTPIEGTQPPAPARASRATASHWRGDWRSDRRYDWRDHRRRHRSLFRFGFYYDPFGWRYRPYSIGWRLWPSYYHSRYWLHDAWMYRLPHAPPGYRWIRYYDDALLVDTWDGQVVDVIRDFFW